jgi:hypothetical protein
MNFTISASGTNKQDTLEQLESQREKAADYTSLKNQVLEHVAGYVSNLPDDTTSIGVSVSVGIGYQASASGEGAGAPAADAG